MQSIGRAQAPDQLEPERFCASSLLWLSEQNVAAVISSAPVAQEVFA